MDEIVGRVGTNTTVKRSHHEHGCAVCRERIPVGQPFVVIPIDPGGVLFICSTCALIISGIMSLTNQERNDDQA